MANSRKATAVFLVRFTARSGYRRRARASRGQTLSSLVGSTRLRLPDDRRQSDFMDAPPILHRSRWILAAALATAAAPAQESIDTGFAACRETVLPSAEELLWREIPWRDAFGIAVLEANAQERPVLLWAMNGHPLGCT